MISEKEVHVLDKNSEFHGVPTINLMENAGKGVAEFIKKQLKPEIKNILIFCGTGNNGGDGFVAARYLSKKYNVNVFLAGKEIEIKTDISKKNFQKIQKQKIKIFNITELNKVDDFLDEAHIIIDAMLGIGLTGELKQPYYSIVKKINRIKNKTKISIDIPTGFGTNVSMKPDYTITFHDIKTNMTKQNCGIIKILDIGIPKKASEYVGPGELVIYYPKSKKDSHKGDNGRLLIVGGGPYYGAPALSSFAAQRTGCDLVYIVTPKRVAQAITSYSPFLIKPLKFAKELAKYSPNLIVENAHDTDKLISKDIKLIEKLKNKTNALLIGPGIGSHKETHKLVEEILKLYKKENKPIIIDADAIQVVGKKPEIIKNSKTVITPHTGEFKELTSITLSKNLNERRKNVEKWAKKIGLIILLKGPIDIISDGTQTKLNNIHNEAMTVGGTGDVLAGIVGALMSKNVEPYNAARMGAFINGYAGNLAFKKKSYGLISTDIIEEIPNVLTKYL
ncbi:MAG: NAD(P)H-hydrate dehydratase [Thermoplasmatales archaeon]|nr:MAG: NAD(P)H-hydrate dehydratase [Thermoplasmatales archaeon]